MECATGDTSHLLLLGTSCIHMFYTHVLRRTALSLFHTAPMQPAVSRVRPRSPCRSPRDQAGQHGRMVPAHDRDLVADACGEIGLLAVPIIMLQCAQHSKSTLTVTVCSVTARCRSSSDSTRAAKASVEPRGDGEGAPTGSLPPARAVGASSSST
jgi:hypothetical protein